MSEVIIYHHLYNRKSGTFELVAQATGSTVPVAVRGFQGGVSSMFKKLSKLSALVGIALIISLAAPKALVWGKDLISTTFANFQMSEKEVQTLQNDLNMSNSVNIPPFDAGLPKVNSLVIPSIGVDTEVQEATLNNYEDALRKGVWRVSDFGAPDTLGEPIILAAHRFGYLAWTNSYRHLNSFYNLPKIKVGDVVEIDWSQRKYLYEVYATSEGSEILDYSADLILYTCETLTGENKVFVYAKRLL